MKQEETKQQQHKLRINTYQNTMKLENCLDGEKKIEPEDEEDEARYLLLLFLLVLSFYFFFSF
jgi:hypothetical protein